MKDLKTLRQEAGMTQHALAMESGLRQATVSALENGRTKAQSGTIHALAIALGQDPNEVRTALNATEKVETQLSTPGSTIVESPEVNFDQSSLERLQWNWTNAKRAVEGHTKQWKEAMMFLDPILKKHPEFLDARKLMRTAEIHAALKIPLSDRIPPPQSYIGKALKKIEEDEALEAMEILEEKVFVYMPADFRANAALHKAAAAAGLHHTARYALEFAAEQNPDEKAAFHRLADYYQEQEELTNACLALKRITEIDPNDLEAAKAYRDMTALDSMQSGKIEKKDPSGARELETGRRIALTDEQKRTEIDRLVKAFHQDTEAKEDSPEKSESSNGLRKAVKFSQELGESDIEYLEYALDLQHLLVEAFPHDPVLLSQLDEMSVAVLDRKLKRAEANLADCEEGTAVPEYEQAAVEKLRDDRNEMLVAVAERMALANPTNAEMQLKLGQAYIEIGKFRQAVAPLQKAKRDPRNRIDLEAMSLLSDCFVAGGLKELAIKEIDEALAKLETDGGEKADSHWKNLNYKKAMLLERNGNPDEAKNLFAEIFAKDSSFKDVEERVWGT